MREDKKKREEKDSCQQLLLVLLLLYLQTQSLEVLTIASQLSLQFGNFHVALHVILKDRGILGFQFCATSLLLSQTGHQVGFGVGKPRVAQRRGVWTRCPGALAFTFEKRTVLLVQEQCLWIAAKGGIGEATFLVDGSGRNGLVLGLERGNGSAEPLESTLLLCLCMGMQARELLFRGGMIEWL